MRVEQIGDATLINGDCMEGLAEMVENQFDLAIDTTAMIVYNY